MQEIATALPANSAQRLLSFRLDAKQDYYAVARMFLYSSVGLSLLSFAVAGWYLRKAFAKSPSEMPGTANPLVVTPAGERPAAEEWRWR